MQTSPRARISTHDGPIGQLQSLLLCLSVLWFVCQVVDKASKACSGICMWVRAMYKYYTVALQVEPKKKRLAEAQESLDRTMAGTLPFH